MDPSDDQQFCLRWNNFQANITSQFETLRDDEDFIDVTIACEGQRLQAHKVVLSACSPFFKDLFKNNPCSHPIIFMRDVEASHIVALLEFMYAGEVNVAQAQLSGFLKTAESLRIRGLTDTSPDLNPKDEDTPFLDQDPLLPHKKHQNIAYNSAVTSSQDIRLDKQVASSPPPNKKQSSQESDLHLLQTQLEDAHLQRLTQAEDTLLANAIALGDARDFDIDNKSIQPKLENPDYLSDEDRDEPKNYFHNVTTSSIIGGMEIIPHLGGKDPASDNVGPVRLRRRRLSENWTTFDSCSQSGAVSPDILSRLRNCKDKPEGDRRNKLVKLGEGIEIYEDQLRSVKWSDYRKLTRGLATILFSPAELATCSVTGQRWSRAGSGERPVKPALDKNKVQAIISYVATRFPMVEISRIKQVLAYKCKENSTAFKMKAVRYYGDQIRESDKN